MYLLFVHFRSVNIWPKNSIESSMPGRRLLCGCLPSRRKRSPSDVTSGVVNGAMTLRSVEAEEPMPSDEEELNNMFEELVVSDVTLRNCLQISRVTRIVH